MAVAVVCVLISSIISWKISNSLPSADPVVVLAPSTAIPSVYVVSGAKNVFAVGERLRAVRKEIFCHALSFAYCFTPLTYTFNRFVPAS